jgi:trehalose 6-phosphate synthase
VHYVAVAHDVYDKYYNIIANPMLWFIQHYLWDLGRHPDISPNEVDAWEHGYVPVQRLFAEAIAGELRAGAAGAGGAAVPAAGPGALVMLHDYHLYGVAPLVRAAA